MDRQTRLSMHVRGMSIRSMAQTLGVSATTVSLALKNSPRVSEALRKRIHQLARETGYVPNARLSELMDEVRQCRTTSYRGTLAAFALFPEEHPWTRMPHLKIVYDTAREVAARHGYQLEYHWLGKPGMSAKRFCGILSARGIQGLLCLGSLDPEARLPRELEAFTVVAWGPTVADKLHRVMSHFMLDARTLLAQLQARGYRRPGLLMLTSGDHRTDFTYSDTFVGAQSRYTNGAVIPVLRSNVWDEKAFDRWFVDHEPDVLVLHQEGEYIAGIENYLRRKGLDVPDDIGMALLDKIPDLRRYSGICQDIGLMATAAAELLISRVHLRDFGWPAHPKSELVEGEWNEGKTLRAVAKSALEPAARNSAQRRASYSR